jgi:hypothetical protein
MPKGENGEFFSLNSLKEMVFSACPRIPGGGRDFYPNRAKSETIS